MVVIILTIIDALSPMKSAYLKRKNISKGRGEYHHTYSGTEYQKNTVQPKRNQTRNLREDPGPKGGGMLQA